MRRPWQPRQTALWWWRNPAYRRYMLREATAVPLLLYALCLLYGIRELARGETAFIAWLGWMSSPPLLALQLVALVAAFGHAWTWFKLLPKILVIPTPRGVLPGHWLRLANLLIAVLCWVLLPALAWWSLMQYSGSGT